VILHALSADESRACGRSTAGGMERQMWNCKRDRMIAFCIYDADASQVLFMTAAQRLRLTNGDLFCVCITEQQYRSYKVCASLF
jgi:hypothetical protein